MRRRSIFNRRPRAHSAPEPLTPTLNWDIEVYPVFSNNEIASGYKAIHRNDDGGMLNIVKSGYQAGTNARFMEVVTKIHEFTGFKIEGYSQYQGGKKVLAYLKNTEPVKIADFETDNYMVLGNSFDCSTSWFTGNVNQVLRCTNAFGKINVNHRFKHNSQLDKNIDSMVKFYQGYVDQECMLKEKFETWAGIRVPEELKELFADHVLEIPETNVSAIKQNQKRSLFDSINREIGDMGDNVYGLFNGLTHYTTHKTNSREKVFGNVLGHTAKLNSRGYEMLEEYTRELVH